MKFSLLRRERNGQNEIKKTVLKGARLMVVRLIEANLQRAILVGANLRGGNLEGANLWGVHGLTIEQLSKVKSLYDAKLDPVLMAQVKEKYPHLLEGPKLEE